MRLRPTLLLLATAFVLACEATGSDDSGSGSGEGDGDGDGESAEGSGTGDGDGDAACDMLLECMMKVGGMCQGLDFMQSEAMWGPGGTCWDTDPPEDCIDDCGDCVDTITQTLEAEGTYVPEECGGSPLCPGMCCAKDAACNKDYACCEGTECFLEGASQCLCIDLPERCSTCTNDCLAMMIMPEICEMSCATWCTPDLEADPC